MSNLAERQQAHDLSEAALENISSLHTIIKSISDLADNGNIETLKELSKVGCQLSLEYLNYFDCEREGFQSQLDKPLVSDKA